MITPNHFVYTSVFLAGKLRGIQNDRRTQLYYSPNELDMMWQVCLFKPLRRWCDFYLHSCFAYCACMMALNLLGYEDLPAPDLAYFFLPLWFLFVFLLPSLMCLRRRSDVDCVDNVVVTFCDPHTEHTSPFPHFRTLWTRIVLWVWGYRW